MFQFDLQRFSGYTLTTSAKTYSVLQGQSITVTGTMGESFDTTKSYISIMPTSEVPTSWPPADNWLPPEVDLDWVTVARANDNPRQFIFTFSPTLNTPAISHSFTMVLRGVAADDDTDIYFLKNDFTILVIVVNPVANANFTISPESVTVRQNKIATATITIGSGLVPSTCNFPIFTFGSTGWLTIDSSRINSGQAKLKIAPTLNENIQDYTIFVTLIGQMTDGREIEITHTLTINVIAYDAEPSPDEARSLSAFLLAWAAAIKAKIKAKSPAVKVEPTLSLGEFTQNGTNFQALISYNGDGVLSASPDAGEPGTATINSSSLLITGAYTANNGAGQSGNITAAEGTRYLGKVLAYTAQNDLHLQDAPSDVVSCITNGLTPKEISDTLEPMFTNDLIHYRRVTKWVYFANAGNHTCTFPELIGVQSLADWFGLMISPVDWKVYLTDISGAAFSSTTGEITLSLSGKPSILCIIAPPVVKLEPEITFLVNEVTYEPNFTLDGENYSGSIELDAVEDGHYWFSGTGARIKLPFTYVNINNPKMNFVMNIPVASSDSDASGAAIEDITENSGVLCCNVKNFAVANKWREIQYTFTFAENAQYNSKTFECSLYFQKE